VQFALDTLGTDYIDIIVLCRVSPAVPIEESVAAMAEVVASGKARHIALSEAAAPLLRRAAAVAPIYAIEQEWSLWTRDIEEEIVPTARELGIKIIAYSPLGRGFLTGSIRSLTASDALDASDYRVHGQPRFQGENLEKNLALVDAVSAIAARKGVTTGQIALVWLQAQGEDVIPIPGTSSIKHLDENLGALNVVLSAEDLAEINGVLNGHKVVGNRYAHMAMTFHGNK
jgi:aryl-alcohol dehydrogenase-like predicted oxidoreductase